MPADAVSLRCLKNCEHGDRTTQMKHATAVGGNMLVVTDARAQVVAELVVAATEALGGGEALEPAHTSDAAFYAPMILLKSVVLEGAVPVLNPLAQC